MSECSVCGALHARDEDHVFEYVNADTIEVDVIDAITAQPIVDGVQLPCEHMFSRRSLLQCLATNHACPVCRTPAAPSDSKSIMRIFKNKLDELLVFPQWLCHERPSHGFFFFKPSHACDLKIRGNQP